MTAQAGAEDGKLSEVIRAIIDQPSAKQSEPSLSRLLDALSSRYPPTRAKAFTALALLLREQAQAGASLSAPLEGLLQSSKTDDVCRGLAGLSAVFQLSPADGLAIIQSDGFLARLADSAIDLLALGPSKTPTSDLSYALAEFLALVMNQKAARELIRSDWPGCVDWLTRIALATSTAISLPARCAGCLALVKLRLTSELPEGAAKLPSFTKLTRVMLTAFLANPSLVTTAVEGLALVSQRPSARQILMGETEALLRAFQALQSGKDPVEVDRAMMTDSSIAYGIVTVLLHLSSFKVLKSDEDEAADRLRKLAVRGGKTGISDKISEVEEDEDLVIDDEAVFGWIQDALRRNNDLMDTLGWLVKSESKEVRRTTGKVLLNLVERQECRGKVLQAGGGRMLMKIIAALTISTTMSEAACGPSDQTGSTSGAVLDPSDLPTIQALAKILITTNPLLIFGPSSDSPVLLSTLKPLTALFVHPSATLLQTFEALMALTNLTSLGPRIATQVAETPRVLARLEECMVGVRTGENDMVRRAATELVCNLSTTPAVLESFAPPSDAGQSSGSKLGGSFSTRLHLLIALSSSEDLHTALAAAGALAILTEQSSAICQALLTQQKLAESLCRVAGDVLAEGKIGVQHRLVSLLGNVMSEVTPDQSVDHLFDPSLVEALRDLVNRLGDEDDESKQVKNLTRLVLGEIEKRVKITEIQS